MWLELILLVQLVLLVLLEQQERLVHLLLEVQERLLLEEQEHLLLVELERLLAQQVLQPLEHRRQRLVQQHRSYRQHNQKR